MIKEWESCKAAKEELKITTIGIALCKIRSYGGGFIWKYKDEVDSIMIKI